MMIRLGEKPFQIHSDENIFLVIQVDDGFEKELYETIFRVVCLHKHNVIMTMRALPLSNDQIDFVGFAFSQDIRAYPPNLVTFESRNKQYEINLKFLTRLVQTNFPGYETFQFT